jgi:SAM-dependent methyltransferase
MSTLTPFEEVIHNEGERLVFGRSHGVAEDVRHRSSYLFFREVLRRDLQGREAAVVDLGCGMGHGCETLAEERALRVLGVDVSAECLAYARALYPARNLRFRRSELAAFVRGMDPIDYAVSRGVFEHVPAGLDVAFSTRFRERLLFDVPYDEPAGNPHHTLLGIREEHFAPYGRLELFYQDLAGVIYDRATRPARANMIIAVKSRPGLPPAASYFEFPVPAWAPTGEYRAPARPPEMVDAGAFRARLAAALTPAEVTLDVGRAPWLERPAPALQLRCDPALTGGAAGAVEGRRALELRVGWRGAVEMLPERSVDTVFLLGALSQVSKEEARTLLPRTWALARKQVVIVGPIGSPGPFDGAPGGEDPEAAPGWLPEELGAPWTVVACADPGAAGELGSPLGSFFAVCDARAAADAGAERPRLRVNSSRTRAAQA